MTTKTPQAFSGLRLLSAEDILGAQDISTEPVPTPEWGAGTGVLVRAMSGTERFAYDRSTYEVKRDPKTGRTSFEINELHDSRTALVVLCVVDEAGDHIFTRDQVDALATKNAAPLERIADVARRLSGLLAGDSGLGEASKNGSGSG